MIEFYCFPPAFGLPSPGPFALKTEVHLKMMDLPYTHRFEGYLHGQGLGRHNLEDVTELAGIGYAALARLLGNKPYLLGDRPCGVDASMFAQLVSVLTPFFDGPVRDTALCHPNLVAYANRMMASHFQEYASA